MRWENLTAPPVEGDPGRAAPATPPLPLALPDAVVRTFDTPEFAGMTFYEVRAKSILNKVPGTSRVPFEWTVNPYRGCSHACFYCLSGDTPILMADGGIRPIRDLEVGDRIYGTERRGAYRRYVVTTVLAKWSTTKLAYRLTLEDGTTLVASGDHRFLTERGWKHVTGTMQGDGQRPYLTTNNRLIGTGRFAAGPKENDAYRKGYLSGMIRGDGNLGTYVYPYGVVHRFRLALADEEALHRTQQYLWAFGVETTRFSFTPASSHRRAMEAIRSSKAADVDTIRRLITWPAQPDDDWYRGFLAGIFDAEGSCSRGILRISNTDDAMLTRTADALRHFGLSAVLEDRGLANRVRTVRLTGGLAARLRFFHLTGPAISRKRSIEGAAVKCQARLRVTAIECLGLELPLWDITTGTGDFVADGVVSHNCFARNTHTYLDFDAGADFDSQVVVKVNAGELLRRELAAPRWRGAHVAMGTNVDCYQRAEGRYRLMPPIIEALRDFANPFSILTKGTLIQRDLPLLRQAAEGTRVSVAFSVGFLDERLWRSVEPGTPSPRRRLDAVRRFADAGFEVGVLMAPILPGLSDSDESIEATVAAIANAGAASVTPLPLHLRPGAREWYAQWLGREHPRLVPRYRELFGAGAYAPQSYQRELTARVRIAARRHGLIRSGAGEHRAAPQPAPAPEQLSLL
ncbi:intein-containing Rv2578c family radical SAM protein [Verrucosispora sp. WMMA2044]|uniref:intein-containing Rv2578c family radical SAM protein n=1 Tax=Verrucosispora sp. WMMA2044 TaxID=3016419 RepID=UPI00248C1501|nr:intein-containing Rv2578c family radical SAM protein [Verrucosispora sp. WMMA2044]WBB47742.1 intein-containing Rv2578c family radical SAM protein [Verrucosispora sp. WMMA2044]